MEQDMYIYGDEDYPGTWFVRNLRTSSWWLVPHTPGGWEHRQPWSRVDYQGVPLRAMNASATGAILRMLGATA